MPQARFIFLLFVFVLAVCGGCRRAQTPDFAPRPEIADLVPKHQQQIAAALEKYFGTPLHPRFMAARTEQPDEAKEPVLVEHLDRQHLAQGREVYTRQCAGCHGTTGNGQGPAAMYLNPPPRDYQLGKFKFTSTPRGGKPRRADLTRIIRGGAKGTSMPTFRWMPQEELEAVIDYVILLSSRGELEFRLMKVAEAELAEEDDLDPFTISEHAQFVAAAWANADSLLVQPLTPQPKYDDGSIEAGARAFVRLNCYKCHGPDGRGNKAQDVGKDDWGRVAHAADLTTGMLHGGRRPVDIYRRIYSGINGTPMPGFSVPDTAQGETDQQRSETVWRLSHFITSIVEGRPLPAAVIDEEIKEQLKKLPPTPAEPTTGG
jgi:mono/diheme cytochrome c family protein